MFCLVKDVFAEDETAKSTTLFSLCLHMSDIHHCMIDRSLYDIRHCMRHCVIHCCMGTGKVVLLMMINFWPSGSVIVLSSG